jgi:hypothetical protein
MREWCWWLTAWYTIRSTIAAFTSGGSVIRSPYIFAPIEGHDWVDDKETGILSRVYPATCARCGKQEVTWHRVASAESELMLPPPYHIPSPPKDEA